MNLRNIFIIWKNYFKRIRLNRSRIRFLHIALSVSAIVVSIALMYVYVWRAVNQDIGLPPGVSAQDPVLNKEALQILNQQRVDRVRASLNSFEAATTLFTN